MKEFTVHCGACQGKFKIRHPALPTLEKVMQITTDCPFCGVTIKAPNDELLMIPMGEYMRRSMIANGFNADAIHPAPEVSAIDLDTGNVVPINRNAKH